MADQNALQRLFHQHGCNDYRWVEPSQVVIAQWVRMKCAFGCESYGRNAACPPNTPPLAECRDFFREYRLAAMFRFDSPGGEAELQYQWIRQVNTALLALEREIVASGYHRGFLLFLDSCNFCRDCAKTRHNCRNRRMARPSPQAMGVDLTATAARFGFAGAFDSRQHYALMLLE